LRAISAVTTGRGAVLAGAACIAFAALAGCGSSSKSTSSVSTSAAAAPSTTEASATAPSAATAAVGVRVSSATVGRVGVVLTNGEGKTLYTFAPDHHAAVTCVQSCAIVWPPLKVPSGGTPLAAGSVKTALISSSPDPEGGRVVTYAGWPLYLYAGDSGPGTAKGQALNINGGLWYVITPSGQVITKTP
jgi:predicted lipoprotein with Yx(FWY)xxD motif